MEAAMMGGPREMRTFALMTCTVLCFGCGGKSGGAPAAGAGNDISSTVGSEDSGATKSDASVVQDTVAPTADADAAAAPPTDTAATPAADGNAAPDAVSSVGDAGSGSDVGGGGDAGGGSTAYALAACHKDEDCVLIEVGCCGHCNGGKLMSVNGKAKPEALAKYKAKDCKGKKCTLMGCTPKVPVCVLAQTPVAGQCAYKTKGSPGPADCPSLSSRKACKGQAGCVELWGWKPADMCNNKTGDKIFAGCVKGGFGCTGALACGVEDGSGQALVFPSGCLPQGWKSKPMATCCP